MKITKIGRQRPVHYQGKYNVPNKVVSRLAASRNHLVLANIASFNGRVDQYYLVIDNLLSAIIIAKEGGLTTRNHKKKIKKFFEHLGRRAKVRKIEKTDFDEFYDLWQRSRYHLYFPKSSLVNKMAVFTSHLFDFTVTETARFFRSDETILARKIDELQEIYESEKIHEEVSHIHESRQMEAEELGERYGARLGMKLANPWNFIDVSLLSDKETIVDNIDQSEEIEEILVDFLKSWDKLISEVQMLNLKHIAKKNEVDEDEALKEAIDAAANHPETLKFRLILNFSFDSSEPKEVASSFSKIMWAVHDMIEHPQKAIKDSWEIYKEY